MQEILSKNPKNCTQTCFERIVTAFKELNGRLVFLSAGEFNKDENGTLLYKLNNIFYAYLLFLFLFFCFAIFLFIVLICDISRIVDFVIHTFFVVERKELYLDVESKLLTQYSSMLFDLFGTPRPQLDALPSFCEPLLFDKLLDELLLYLKIRGPERAHSVLIFALKRLAGLSDEQVCI